MSLWQPESNSKKLKLEIRNPKAKPDVEKAKPDTVKAEPVVEQENQVF